MNEAAPAETLIVPASANLSEATYQRLRESADKRCGTCKTQSWRLTKRQVRTGWQRWLQCIACGNTTGQALRQKDHPSWRDYPLFNAEQYEQWHRDKAETAAIERADRYEVQRLDYAEWTATSLEWKAMRKRVMARAGNICEACLERPATDVHHKTYDLGKLPPAYCLTALCHSCHERLHTEGDEWGPPVRVGPTRTDDVLSDDDPDGEIPFD